MRNQTIVIISSVTDYDKIRLIQQEKVGTAAIKLGVMAHRLLNEETGEISWSLHKHKF
jgi:hypothetical protein